MSENRYRTKPNLKTFLKFELVVSVFVSLIFFFSVFILFNILNINLSLNQLLIMFVVIIFLAFLQPIVSFFRLKNKEYLFKNDKLVFMPEGKKVYYENINSVSYKKTFGEIGDVLINTPVGQLKLKKVYHGKKVCEFLRSLLNN